MNFPERLCRPDVLASQGSLPNGVLNEITTNRSGCKRCGAVGGEDPTNTGDDLPFRRMTNNINSFLGCKSVPMDVRCHHVSKRLSLLLRSMHSFQNEKRILMEALHAMGCETNNNQGGAVTFPKHTMTMPEEEREKHFEILILILEVIGKLRERQRKMIFLPLEDPDTDGDKDWADVRESAASLPRPPVESCSANKADKFYDFLSYGSRAKASSDRPTPDASLCPGSFPPQSTATRDSSNICATNALNRVPNRQVLDSSLRCEEPAISQLFRNRSSQHTSLQSALTPSSPTAKEATPFTTRFAHLIPPLGALSKSSRYPLPVSVEVTTAKCTPAEGGVGVSTERAKQNPVSRAPARTSMSGQPKFRGKKCEVEGCQKLSQGRTVFCASHGGGRRCQSEGCSKIAQGSTQFCAAHGGGRRCQVEGCSKSAAGATPFCKGHGGGRRCQHSSCSRSAQGSTFFCMAHGGGRRCSVFGCAKSVISTTPFCRLHGGQRHCSQLDCERVAQGNSALCIMHGGGRRLCQKEGCFKSSQGNTPFCILHGGGRRCTFQVEGPSGPTNCHKLALGKTKFCVRHGGGKRCLVVGCTKGAQGRTNLCRAHGGGRRCSVRGCSKMAADDSTMCPVCVKVSSEGKSASDDVNTPRVYGAAANISVPTGYSMFAGTRR